MNVQQLIVKNERPHQALWNFTAAKVHNADNKSSILAELEKEPQIHVKTSQKGVLGFMGNYANATEN